MLLMPCAVLLGKQRWDAMSPGPGSLLHGAQWAHRSCSECPAQKRGGDPSAPPEEEEDGEEEG